MKWIQNGSEMDLKSEMDLNSEWFQNGSNGAKMDMNGFKWIQSLNGSKMDLRLCFSANGTLSGLQ